MWRLDGMQPRVLVTGVGGPAAQGFIDAFEHGEVDWFVVDADPLMPGFQLFGPDRRAVVPRGGAPGFVDALLRICLEARVDVVVPTVDTELKPLAAAARRFEAAGIHVLVAGTATLERCLDKATLAARLRTQVRVPQTEILGAVGWSGRFSGRVVTKPRSGSGSRGVAIHESIDALGEAVPRDGTYIVQEYLPGPEYSIDVFADRAGTVVACVPRERIRVDSGIAVAARSLHDPELEGFAARVATAIGLRGVANVQVRRDRHRRPALLEVNPRFPGTMSLTVASGVNMPRLALTEALGTPIPHQAAFRETVMVRTWSDHIIDPSVFGRSAQSTEQVA